MNGARAVALGALLFVSAGASPARTDDNCEFTLESPSAGHLRIGAWNLHRFGAADRFHDGQPLGGRTDEHFDYVARRIAELEIKILLIDDVYLQREEDIDISSADRQSKGQINSAAINDLKRALLDNEGLQFEGAFGYWQGASLKSQFAVVLWDTTDAELLASCQGRTRVIPMGPGFFETRIERPPHFFHFRLKDDRRTFNTLVVVGINLPDKEDYPYSEALRHIMFEFDRARGRGQPVSDEACIPADEEDFAIMGVTNLDLAGSHDEGRPESRIMRFLEKTGIALLAQGDYEETELVGSPPMPTDRHDYVLVSRQRRRQCPLFDEESVQAPMVGGLLNDEVSDLTAEVHEEIACLDWKNFLDLGSNHLPVTIDVRLTEDSDGSPPRVDCVQRRL